MGLGPRNTSSLPILPRIKHREDYQMKMKFPWLVLFVPFSRSFPTGVNKTFFGASSLSYRLISTKP
jgi:hypothetical protein